MSKKLAAGNWKMNGLAASLAEIDALAGAVKGAGCEVLICPPAILIAQMAAKAKGSNVFVGGQDCHPKVSGAHTGDVAAAMLADAGASHVILGHSERRADHGESDADIRAKAEAAGAAGLVRIICVGETEGERDAGQTLAVIGTQLDGSVPDAATAADTVIAYEPVWAIGTGQVASPEQAQEVCAALRTVIAQTLGEDAAARTRVLYGGSVKAANIASFMREPDVDGALVGGASLVVDEFAAIIRYQKHVGV